MTTSRLSGKSATISPLVVSSLAAASPQDDLAAAEKLIHDCGYHRRDEELADAKRAILGT